MKDQISKEDRERIEDEAGMKSNPVKNYGCGPDAHVHGCQCGAWEEGYIAGATTECLRKYKEIEDLKAQVKAKDELLKRASFIIEGYNRSAICDEIEKALKNNKL